MLGWTIVAAIAANGIVLPLLLHTGADLTALATLIASTAPLVIARSYEKAKGVS